MKGREEYIAILEVENVELKKKQRSLIKYLEDKIKDCEYQIDIVGNYQKICERRAYIDILERLKSDKYE